MRTQRHSIPTLATALVVSVATAAWGGDPTDPIVPGEAIVRANSTKALAQSIAALSAQFQNVSVVDQIDGRPIYLLGYGLEAGQAPEDVNVVLQQLLDAGTIAWGELNYAGQTGEGRTGSLWLSGLGLGSSQFGSQYAVPLLGLDEAHARSRGAGVTIAVIDTGVDAAHPALGGCVSPAGASFVPGTSPHQDDGDGIDNDGDGIIDEQVGHGTFVAGLIHLVAPEAVILPVRVLDSEGRAGNFQIARALAWSIDRGAHVANLSLGEDYRSKALEDVVAEAETRGVVVLGAAGNRGVDDPREFPACDGAAIGVAALDAKDVRAGFSNFGDRIDLSAPGASRIVKGVPDLARSIVGPVPGGGYAVWQGTSFATAFASGVTALVRAQHPEWPNAEVDAAQVRATVLATLGATGVDVSAANPDFVGLLGLARISASGAVAVGPIAPPRGDVDGDGSVGAGDLAAVLASWGPCGPGARADLDASGDVGPADLALVLAYW